MRDSVLDNRFQREAAFNVIKAYEDIIQRMKDARQLDDPPIPDETNTKPPVTALAMPEIYQKYLGALDWYIQHVNDEKIPDLRYMSAVLAAALPQLARCPDAAGTDHRHLLRRPSRRWGSRPTMPCSRPTSSTTR